MRSKGEYLKVWMRLPGGAERNGVLTLAKDGRQVILPSRFVRVLLALLESRRDHGSANLQTWASAKTLAERILANGGWDLDVTSISRYVSDANKKLRAGFGKRCTFIQTATRLGYRLNPAIRLVVIDDLRREIDGASRATPAG